MNEEIQNTIKDADLASDVKLRIDFIDQVRDSDLKSIDSLLSEALFDLGLGLGAAHGTHFIEASLLDFGETPNFLQLRDSVNKIVNNFQSIITKVSYHKTEYTQAHFDFVSEKKMEFEAVLEATKNVFSEVDFTPISTSSNSPENKNFSGSDSEKSITLFVSEFNYDQKDWIRFSIGCKRLTDDEIDCLSKRLNEVQDGTFRVNWKGFDYNDATEAWVLPKHHILFELIWNDSNAN